MTQESTANSTIGTGSHLCAAPICYRVIASQFLMCPGHWRRVPHSIRSRIWASWRRLQAAETFPELANARQAYETAREAAIRSLQPQEAR